MNEAVKLPFLDVPAESALLDGLAHVQPFKAVLSVVVVVEAAEDGASLLFSQDGPGFIGGAVNIFGGPQQRDFVGPVFGEQVFSLGDALQGWP